MKTSRRQLFRTALSAPAASSIVWSRRVPVRYDADLAVLRGGLAGVSAACAAARSGARVILVERFAITGGVANFCGQMEGQGEVLDCVLDGLRRFKALDGKRGSLFHYEILAVILQEMLLARKSGARARPTRPASRALPRSRGE